MAEDVVYITVFRSAEMSAVEEALSVRDMLIEAGLPAILVEDDAQGVVEGTCEVRVPTTESLKAEELIASRQPSNPQIDKSESVDLVPIFSSQGANAEIEALGIKGILDANGIPALLVEGPSLPNLPHEVRVPKDRLEEAQQLIAEARAAGPQAAEEASGQSLPLE